MENKKFLSIKDASRYTGLSTYFIRNGCKDNTIPCIQSGTKYYVNMDALLAVLDAKSQQAV